MPLPSCINPYDPYESNKKSSAARRPSWMDEGLASPSWLYGFGDWERYRLLKMRENSVKLVNHGYQAGVLPSHSPMRYFRTRVHFQEKSRSFPVIIYHSGALTLRVNDIVVAHYPRETRSVGRSLDLAPYLHDGNNEVLAILARRDEPCALFVGWAISDMDLSWEVSEDWLHWGEPDRYVFTAPTIFPHRECLSSMVISAKKRGALHDFEHLFLGNPLLWVHGEGKISVFSGESPEEAESPSELQEASIVARDRTTSGSNAREGENDGTEVALGPVAARYLRVETTRTVVLDDLAMAVEIYPVSYKGWFECSDPLLTAIWQISAYTLRLCMREFLLDGIKRDRLPWAGDLTVAVEANAHIFFDNGIIRRTLTALAPAAADRNPINGLDDYTFHWILGLSKYINYSGDIHYLQKIWPYLSSAVYAMTNNARMENGLYQPFSGGMMFVDWGTIPQECKLISVRMMHIWSLAEAVFLANVLGKEKEINHWQKSLEVATDAICACWNESRRVYCDENGRAPRHAQFLAILAGIADADKTQYLAEALVGSDSDLEGSVDTPYMKYFELKSLALAGKRVEMLAEIRRYWGGMIEMGASTFWEAFTPGESAKKRLEMYRRPFARSLCHAWAAGAAALLAGDLAGLRCEEVGWRTFSCENYLPRATGVYGLDVGVPTPNGTIHIEYDGSTVTASRRAYK